MYRCKACNDFFLFYLSYTEMYMTMKRDKCVALVV